MKRIFMLVLASLLAACGTYRPPGEHAAPVVLTPEMVRGAVATPRSVGGEALNQVQGWYARKDQNCGAASRPAFLCTGVMLRATETNPAFFPWDPSPASIASGGVSFSWLRVDDNFARLAYGYGNGFIFYPVLDTPGGKNSDIGVLCVFPTDADTNNRPTLQGCGPHTKAISSSSGPCAALGIVTSAKWLSTFGSKGNIEHCGWNTREGATDAASHFYQSVLARQGLATDLWATQNELRLATWAKGSGASLPIRAFFYLPVTAGALTKAQSDQRRYYDQYYIVIPILRITLPSSKTGSTSFSYVEADQVESGLPPIEPVPAPPAGK